MDAPVTAQERDVSLINPLIATNGDTSQVQAALNFLAHAFLEAR